MRNSNTLGPWLRRFLVEHLVSERNLARNTQLSYRDTLALLLPFAADRAGKPIERLAVPDLSAERVLDFLTWLARERGCSPQTCNQRLNAIRTFARFVGSRSPEHLEWCGQVRAIACRRSHYFGRNPEFLVRLACRRNDWRSVRFRKLLWNSGFSVDFDRKRAFSRIESARKQL